MCVRYLQGCFWMRLTFELVDWVKCLPFPVGWAPSYQLRV